MQMMIKQLRNGIMAGMMALALPGMALAACQGRDLMADMTSAERARVDAAVAQTPFSKGTEWTATRGNARIILIGTYHFDDPRHQAGIDRLAPAISDAATLLVEASADDERQLKARLAADPGLILDPTGPTLPERLTPQDWKALSAAMSERGIPALMVSRMRPWYASMMLSISPCMMAEMKAAGTIDGLDRRLMDMADKNGVPVKGLEPYDTLFRIFDGLSEKDGRDMIRASLIAADSPDDFATTTAEAFFRGDVWGLWEYSVIMAESDTTLTKAEVDHQMKLSQEMLMDRRNESWIAPLETAADDAARNGKHIVAAFGALHLPGDKGVLRLLEKNGWTIAPL